MNTHLNIIEAEFSEYLKSKNFKTLDGLKFYRINFPIVQLVRFKLPDDSLIPFGEAPKGRSLIVTCSESSLFAPEINRNLFVELSGESGLVQKIVLEHKTTHCYWSLNNKLQISKNVLKIKTQLEEIFSRQIDSSLYPGAYLGTKLAGSHAWSEYGLLEKIYYYVYYENYFAARVWISHLDVLIEDIHPSGSYFWTSEFKEWKKKLDSYSDAELDELVNKIIKRNIDLINVSKLL